MTLDLLWKKEQYLKEHDEFFNNANSNDNNNEDEINEEISNELEEISRLLKDGEVSKENLAIRLKSEEFMKNKIDISFCIHEKNLIYITQDNEELEVEVSSNHQTKVFIKDINDYKDIDFMKILLVILGGIRRNHFTVFIFLVLILSWYG